MQEWQQRVVQEEKELTEKVDKLSIFLTAEAFKELEEEDQRLLSRQYLAMLEYQTILGQRISSFK